MNTTSIYKTPVWFKILLVLMILALVGCIYYIKNTNIDTKIDVKKQKKEVIETVIDSISKIRTSSIDALVTTSKNNAAKATQIIKNLPHEKSLPTDTTAVVMLNYIANYQFIEY